MYFMVNVYVYFLMLFIGGDDKPVDGNEEPAQFFSPSSSSSSLLFPLSLCLCLFYVFYMLMYVRILNEDMPQCIKKYL